MSAAVAFLAVRASTGASPSRVPFSGAARSATTLPRNPRPGVVSKSRPNLGLPGTRLDRGHLRVRAAPDRDEPARHGAVKESLVNDDGPSLVDTGVAPRNESLSAQIEIQGVHHVAVIVRSMERSMDFYHRMLGLPVNPDRPNDKLPYHGAWLMMGSEMLHLMELPNPDPDDLEFRPAHGGKDRHFCIGVRNLRPLTDALTHENIPYTASRSGRPAIFFRDPDCNTIEVVQGLEWRDEHDRNLTLGPLV